MTPVLVQLIITVTLVSFAVGTAAVSILYNAAIRDNERQLVSLASNAVALIETTIENERLEHADTPDYKSADSSMEIIEISRTAFSKFSGLGKSGNVMIAQRGIAGITVLMHEDRESADAEKGAQRPHAYSLSADSFEARPMIAGLNGNTGTMISQDEHGHKVIAAYAPIRSLDLALVANAHFSDINAPFIKAIIQTLILGIVFIAFGVFFIYRQTVPVIERVLISESRLQGFTETATEWFWEMGRNLRFKTMGKRGRFGSADERNSYLGRTRPEIAANAEDVTSQKWRDHQDDLENRRPFTDFQYDMIIDGERRTLSVSGVPVFDARGAFQGYQGSGKDVTDLLKDKRQIEEAEERLRGAFEHITMAVILINETGIVESFNPKAEEVFGYRADEVVGKNISMLMPEPDHGRHDQYLRSYVYGGPAKIIGSGREVTGLRKNGEQFPLKLGVAEMMLRGERHFVGSIIDLTAEKAMEQQLRRSQKMDAIGQLTGGIAHDFNNLLGIIVGNLDLVRRKLDPEDKAFKRVENAIKAAERGATLTARLLNFSRQTPEVNEVVDVNLAIKDLRNLVERSITANIEVGIYTPARPSPVRINKGDFEDALINLCVNARDAMPDGGILKIAVEHINVDATLQKSMPNIPIGNYIQISISDNGCGMTQDVAHRIFDPFFTTKPAGKGTGLGMAMVYGFVQRAQGTITVYSEPDLGTTFKIYLPLATDAPADASEDTGKAAQFDSEILTGTETILIVDDEVELADTAKAVLEELGYQALVARDGASALAIIDEKDDIAMLLSDVVMPEMNGFELAELAVQKKPSLKVLLSSGYSGDTSKTSGAVKKEFPMLRKPYNNRQLATQVRRTLDTPTV